MTMTPFLLIRMMSFYIPLVAIINYSNGHCGQQFWNVNDKFIGQNSRKQALLCYVQALRLES